MSEYKSVKVTKGARRVGWSPDHHRPPTTGHWWPRSPAAGSTPSPSGSPS